MWLGCFYSYFSFMRQSILIFLMHANCQSKSNELLIYINTYTFHYRRAHISILSRWILDINSGLWMIIESHLSHQGSHLNYFWRGLLMNCLTSAENLRLIYLPRNKFWNIWSFLCIWTKHIFVFFEIQLKALLSRRLLLAVDFVRLGICILQLQCINWIDRVIGKVCIILFKCWWSYHIFKLWYTQARHTTNRLGLLYVL